MLTCPPVAQSIHSSGSGQFNSHSRVETSVPVEKAALVSALLDYGANPDSVYRTGWTTLHEEVLCDHTATVKVLLDHHADPNVQGPGGQTPLMLAYDLDCARLLIEHGARVSIMDANGKTALDSARGAAISRRMNRQTGRIVITEGLASHQSQNFIHFLEAALKREQAEQESSTRASTK